MNTEETPKIWIGFKQSPVLCHIPDIGDFSLPVHGKFMSIDESPFVFTSQGLKLKDAQPHTIDFEVDLSDLGKEQSFALRAQGSKNPSQDLWSIPKGSLSMNLTLYPASHPEGISLSELADVPAPNHPEGLTWVELKKHPHYEINTEYPHQIWDTYFKDFVNEIDNEYVEVYLCGTRYYKDRIIAGQFIPNPNNLPDLEHINGNKKDNRIENLRRCSLWDEVVKDEWLKYDEDLSLFNINAPIPIHPRDIPIDRFFGPLYEFDFE